MNYPNGQFGRPKKRRRSIRLKDYDYSQAGAYFLTMCVQNREHLFGEVAQGKMILNEYGTVVQDIWHQAAAMRESIKTSEFVVMPNHVHGIVIFTDYVGTLPPVDPVGGNDSAVGVIHESPLRRRNMGLPKFVGRFKMLSAKAINELRRTPGTRVWQRDYYERVIRDADEWERIARYILENPKNWKTDENYVPPNAVRGDS